MKQKLRCVSKIKTKKYTKSDITSWKECTKSTGEKPDKKERIRRKICTSSSKKSQSPFFPFSSRKKRAEFISGVGHRVFWSGFTPRHGFSFGKSF
jgi:hypothetical protein